MRTRVAGAGALAAMVLAGCTEAEEPGATTQGTPAPATATQEKTSADEDAETPPSDEGAETAPADAAEASTEPSSAAAPTTEEATASDVVPTLDVEVVMDGLDIPWDVAVLPDGALLVTERSGRLLARSAEGQVGEVRLEAHRVASGEGGLMGVALSPNFAQDRTVFLCHGAEDADGPEVRVTRAVLDDALAASTEEETIVDGIPWTTGRHSGCRLLFTPEGDLLVGTGDAADDANPQDLDSLGGKVLLVTTDGEPVEKGGHVEGADPRILTYGHRNVQGLALQPGTGAVWEVEHGPDVDDEVNILQPGGNYGWDPGPGYDEGVAMTDLEAFPDAVEAVWSSGDPTHATSGAVFLDGPQWGAWDGALAVAELKGSGVTVMTVDGDEVVDTVRAPELDGTYGRLRSLVLDEDGALWVTSSNGGNDVVLKVVASTG